MTEQEKIKSLEQENERLKLVLGVACQISGITVSELVKYINMMAEAKKATDDMMKGM